MYFGKKARVVIAAASIALMSAGCIISSDDNNGGANNGGANNGGSNNGGSNNGGANNGGPVEVNCSSFESLEGTISEDTTLSADGTCYSAAGLSVAGATLTIEPGVVIQFEENTGLTVNPDGRLKAVGTAEDPIVFTSTRDVRGFWTGVTFDRTDSIDNVLEYVVIQYAGGQEKPGALTVQTCCGDSPSIDVRNSTFVESKTYGVSIAGATDLRSFSGNAMSSNTKGALWIDPVTIGSIGEGNDFTGNELDAIVVEGGSVGGDPQTWPAVNVPYEVQGDIGIDTDLEISAGAEFQFTEGTSLVANRNGSLAVKGTESEPVLFSATEQTRGYWKGLGFDRSASTLNHVDYAIIEYAGGGDWSGGLSTYTCCGDTAHVKITNTTVRESETAGLHMSGTVIEEFASNTFTANGGAAVSIPANYIGWLDADSTFSGNDHDVIEVRGGSVEGEQTWLAADVPYEVTDNFNITTDALVTVSPGTVFQVKEDLELGAGGGAFKLAGESGNEIVFKGTKAEKGHWKGVYFDRTARSDNLIEHVIIEDAGGLDSAANLNFTECCGDTTTATINNVTLRNGAAAGLYLAGSIELTGCSNITIENTESEVAGDATTISELEALCL